MNYFFLKLFGNKSVPDICSPFLSIITFYIGITAKRKMLHQTKNVTNRKLHTKIKKA